MKLKFSLIGIIICLLSVFSFAKSDAMSYYMVSPEKVEEYVKLDLLKDTVKAFEILDKYRAWFVVFRTVTSAKGIFLWLTVSMASAMRWSPNRAEET